MTSNETTSAVATRGVRALRPSDVQATTDLQTSDPALLQRLVAAVTMRCARLPMATAHDVQSVACLTVARVFAAMGREDDAVNVAVRHAMRLVAAAGAEPVEVSVEPDDMRVRLESWQATAPDSIARTNDQREAFRALLQRTGQDVTEAWEAIATAYLQHDKRTCERCAVKAGGRDVTLTSVRAHVAGIFKGDAGYDRMVRADRAVCSAVCDALAPMVREADRGPVQWDADRGDLWEAFGVAWAMVERGDRGDLYVRPTTPTPVAVRVSATSAHAARCDWSADETGAWARTGLQAADALQAATAARDALQAASLFDAPDYLYLSARAARLQAAAGVAAWRAANSERVSPREAMAARVGHVRTVLVDAVPAPQAARPDMVWCDVPAPLVGAFRGWRAMTEVETDRAARPTARRATFVSHPGEGDDRVTSAPNTRDVSASGQVKAFKPVVSPRKRAAGQTGPTVPTRLSPAGDSPREHDADRAARHAARIDAGWQDQIKREGSVFAD
jgi:hypothetical protein